MIIRLKETPPDVPSRLNLGDFELVLQAAPYHVAMGWRIIESFSDWINFQMDMRKHMPETPRSWLLNGPKRYPVMVPEEPWLLVAKKPVLPFLYKSDARRLANLKDKW